MLDSHCESQRAVLGKDVEAKNVRPLGGMATKGELAMAHGQALTLGLYFFQIMFTSCI